MLVLACLQGAGIDLRPMQSIYMFPTLVIFAEGKGIAGAKALIEAGSDAHGLDLDFRQDVRLYYRVKPLLEAMNAANALCRAYCFLRAFPQMDLGSSAGFLPELQSTLEE